MMIIQTVKRVLVFRSGRKRKSASHCARYRQNREKMSVDIEAGAGDVPCQTSFGPGLQGADEKHRSQGRQHHQHRIAARRLCVLDTGCVDRQQQRRHQARASVPQFHSKQVDKRHRCGIKNYRGKPQHKLARSGKRGPSPHQYVVGEHVHLAMKHALQKSGKRCVHPMRRESLVEPETLRTQDGYSRNRGHDS